MSKAWDRGEPPGFWAIGSGECEPFRPAEPGGRGNSAVKPTFTDGRDFRISDGITERKRAD